MAESYADLDIKNNIIHLKSGTACNFNEYKCVDFELGQTFWDSNVRNDCALELLYSGLAVKISSISNNKLETIFNVETESISFSFKQRGTTFICDTLIYLTEEPQLIIRETTNNYPTKILKIEPRLNLINYVNSKFIYVERHIRKQIIDSYIDLLRQICQVERLTLKNSLNLAFLSPDQFAYNLMK